MAMARFLIIGASGFIGQHLLRQLGPEQCLGTYAHTPFDGGIHFDPTLIDPDQFLDLYGHVEQIYLLMAVSSLITCANDPQGSYAINVEASKAIALWCKKHQIPLLFTSSDAVFGGQQGLYDEQHIPTPLVTYGKQKREVEVFLQAHLPHLHTTVRLSKTYSSNPQDKTLLSAWVRAWQQQQPIMCATDQRFNPIHVEDAVVGMQQLMAGQHRGLYHLCGPTPVDRYQLLLDLQECYEQQLGPLPSWQVKACLINELGLAETWPIDISTRIDKLLATIPLHPRTPQQGCQQLIQAIVAERSC
ncbi:dTDP-4-dehydrorhamnose reductase [Magnetococcus marinus MC-1]|uniref:dTDP-4-dehydrorhamnose reductase n=1 Tax=Magnetococcus marinus (strain ATCC BAA-1437 / JCM 17883 / MC-1) TaxID=156889 RepID=A0L6I0_MAGMM|nr:sugar nucleotide-binding protein [Magnetococcus marinus]ABK43573.1 dTDP-4-dehydrorhamnose reductase [Magnetococcus marinus MC-1]